MTCMSLKLQEQRGKASKLKEDGRSGRRSCSANERKFKEIYERNERKKVILRLNQIKMVKWR